jgi:magnesium transporter
MKNEIREQLLSLLEEGKLKAIEEYCAELSSSDIAEAIAELDPETIVKILRGIEIHQSGEVMGYLDLDTQVELAEKLKKEDLASLISHMLSDEGADLINELPEPLSNSLMPLLAKAKREQLKSLAEQEEGTCGALMSADYVTVGPNMTIAQATEKVRLDGPHKETIYYIYVVDGTNRLLGMISLRNLIVNDPRKKVADVMFEDLEMVKTTDPQEKAAETIQKYDLIAIPVINDRDQLVGVVTHDDAADVITEEQTEDMLGMGKIVPTAGEMAYLKSSPLQNFLKRIPWVASLAALGLISGTILHTFQDSLSKLIILALYMPMLADTGGNCGTQSSTVIIRALALKEITPKHFFRIIGKEFATGIMMSVLLGLLAFLKVILLSSGEALPAGFTLINVGIMISLALSIQVVTSTVVGAVLPLVVSAIKLDPALIASPALTTIVDMSGLLIYFSLAKLLLGL